jgi:hypothetical protein
MKKFVIGLFAVALAVPMFAQAPAQTDQPKAEKTTTKKKKKRAPKKEAPKTEQAPKAQ